MRLFQLLAVVLLVLSETLGEALAQESVEALPTDLTVRVGVWDRQVEAASGERRAYRIERSGEVSVGGVRLAENGLVAELAAQSPADHVPFAISIDPRADFAAVISTLARFARVKPVELAGAEAFRMFTDPIGAVETTESAPPFQGTLGRYEMPVSVGLAADGYSCIAGLGTKTYAGGELASESFRLLDGLVMREGGVDSILAKTNDGQDIIARIQSAPQTPWHCVAGVIHAVHLSGWPGVQLELVAR